jgi:hypothetical protein
MFGRAAVIAIAAIFCIAAGPAGGVPAKKKCHYVVKVVHGHKRKVKVCTKPKPKPTSVESVSLSLDSAHSVSKPVTAGEGATLTTQSSGKTLTLTIPKDALLTDATVRMTPVASVSGLPAGVKFLGGVQLEPEGTALLADATLTISAPGIASAQKPRAIAWEGTGSVPLTYAATRAGSQLAVKVVHFSGYGAADGELLSTDARAALQASYPQVLQEMTQARTTDSQELALKALQDEQDWVRSTELIGDPTFMADQKAALETLVPQVERNMIEKSYDRCENQHDVLKELANLQALERGAIVNRNTGNQQLASDDYEKCGSFRLDFETVLTTTTTATAIGNTITETSHVRVLGLPLRLVGTSALIPPAVSAPLEVLGFDYHFRQETAAGPLTSTCDGATTKASPTQDFKAFRLEISADAPPQIRLEVTPGKLETDMTVTCTTPGPGGVPMTSTFQQHVEGVSNQFGQGHSYGAGQNGLLIEGWDYLGGSVFARKTVTVTTTTGQSGVTTTIDEQTTFDLRHTPE